MQPRVAVVASHPIQHFCPLYRALAVDGRVDLKVFFGSTAGSKAYFDKDYNQQIRWQEDLLEGYRHEFLPGAERVTDVTRPISVPELGRRLDEFNPEAVVAYGFFHGLSRATYRWGRRRGRRVLSMADSELRSVRSLGTRIRKRLTVPWFLRQVDGFLTIGDCNEAYYRHYGARPAQFFRSPYPIDQRALDAVLADRDAVRARTRAALSLDATDCVLLVVGKLTARKCPAHAVRALEMALEDPRGGTLRLVLAGDGPERGALEAMAARIGPERIRLLGFVDVRHLPQTYAAVDVLVHPSSQDPHPLAVSEAIYAGLPCIVSDRVGNVGPTDELRVGENGMEYPFGSAKALSEAMLMLASEPELRARMGRRSTELGAARGLQASVDGFVEAVKGRR